ncbi:MAG: hypothetical protein IT381_00140 [Deltaproteobacteria bacterium]|nr:hypothetical protein [Deltaproteobacteria bacterium]
MTTDQHARSVVRSELNIERFMFCVTSRYTKNSHRVERAVVDANGNVSLNAVTVGKIADKEVGVLRIFDLKMIYALLKLWQDAGRPINADVAFAVHELAVLLGLSWSGKSSNLIKQSLQRLRFVPIEWENSYYTKSSDTTEKLVSGFTVLSQLSMHHRAQGRGKPSTKCSFQFEPRLTRNLLENYSKPLRLDEMLKLESEIALMLYTRLDLFLANNLSLEKNLSKLINDLGLDINAYPTPSKRKQLFERAVEELEGCELSTGVISEIRLEQNADKSDFKLIVKKRARALQLAPSPGMPPKAPEIVEAIPGSDGALDALIARGVSPLVARNLVEKFPPERIERQIAHFDWRTKNRSGETKNGGGWLKNAIEGDYVPPDDMLKKEKAKVVAADQLRIQEEERRRSEAELFEEMNARQKAGIAPEKWEQCIAELRTLGVSPIALGTVQQLVIGEVGEGRVVLEATSNLTLALCREDYGEALREAVRRVFGDVELGLRLSA